MTGSIKSRNQGIDLLRIILMFMVCVLHTLSWGGILNVVDVNSVQHKLFWFLEFASYCAVDCFAIISGYMAINKSNKYEKLVDMWLQAFFYSFILTLVLLAFGVGSMGKIDILKNAFPVIFEKFWYFSAFFILYLAMPILNKYLFDISINTAKKMFIILIILFSFSSLFFDAFKTQLGYSTLWIIISYCIGVLAKRIKFFETKSNLFLVITWIFCVIVSWIVYVYFDFSRIMSYTSPLILLNGLVVVILFSRFKFKGTIISRVAPLAFGIYLFQQNQIVWDFLIKNSFAFVADESIFIGFFHVFSFAFLIFISGMIVEFIRRELFNLLKVSSISNKVISLIDKSLIKSFVLLK